jgi:maltooligosyltrehalose trehalohydrolase
VDLDGHRFLAYSQTHDQVGNRARGERLVHLTGAPRAKIAAALVFTSPFVPMLFQGEEWAAGTPFQYFTDHPEPELAKAVREGRRREFAAFGWKPQDVPDPQAPETFERSKLNWAELAQPAHAEMLEWYRRLIQLRRREPALSDGRLDCVRTCFDEAGRWFILERGPILVAFDLAGHPQRLPLGDGSHSVLLASAPGVEASPLGLMLPAGALAILKR